jgi:hypothetical protein
MVYSLSLFCLPPVSPVVCLLQMVHLLKLSPLLTILAALLHGLHHLTDSAVYAWKLVDSQRLADD